MSPLLIIFLGAWWAVVFCVLQLRGIASWLWRNPQAELRNLLTLLLNWFFLFLGVWGACIVCFFLHKNSNDSAMQAGTTMTHYGSTYGQVRIGGYIV